MNKSHRGLNQLPLFVTSGFIIILAVQLFYHHWYKTPLNDFYQELHPPGKAVFYKSISLGSDRLMSYMLLLGVQLHDNQKGRHVNYTHLDYAVLRDWLLTLYELNPLSDYPAFLASRVYSQVKDTAKIEIMISVIEAMFDKNPQQHWRRMTEACLLAKHHMHDLPLALRLAQKISGLPKSVRLPFWARDMELVLLDELNQLESAQLLISSLLQSGEIQDADEIRFLQFRLLKIQQAMSKNKH